MNTHTTACVCLPLSLLAGQICKIIVHVLIDKSMKFGTLLDKAILSIFRVDAKLKNSIYGGHLVFQNGRQ